MLAQNIPLVVFLALIALLFWPSDPRAKATDLDEPDLGTRPNGAHPPTPEGLFGIAP